MTMPNFFIIGANKAGTTSIYHYIKQHPQIYMAPVKEPTFFNIEGVTLDKNRPDHQMALKYGINNIEDYLTLFQGVSDETAIGEASTGYLPNAHAGERIKNYVPDAKLLAILRDPVERAYSNFLMYLQWELEPVSNFTQAIKENHVTSNIYINLGFYYQQLRRYLDIFDQNQIRVYLYEDLKAEPIGLMQDIFRFLGVNETFVPDISIRHNVSVINKNRVLHSFFTRDNPFKAALKPFIPARLRHRIINNLGKKNHSKSVLPTEVRRQLIEVYLEDILKLQDLIQRDLSKWLE